MALYTRCPNGHSIKVKPVHVGRSAICPKCESTFLVNVDTEATNRAKQPPSAEPDLDSVSAEDLEHTADLMSDPLGNLEELSGDRRDGLALGDLNDELLPEETGESVAPAQVADAPTTFLKRPPLWAAIGGGILVGGLCLLLIWSLFGRAR